MSTSTLIIGAGFSGLATAHFLKRRLGPAADVTVLDCSPHVGGKINTVCVAGLPVDTGPDAFLARAAELRGLIDELGLNGDIIEPQPGGAYIWSRGGLRPIPDGASFGLPGKLGPLLRSRLLSPAGVARAGLDILLPTSHRSQDPSVADLVRPRFGSEVYRRLVEPLLGGVHAGDPAALSAKSTVPEIKAMADGHRSLYLTMRSRRAKAPKAAGAPLVSIAGGMATLVKALAVEIGPQAMRAGTEITSVERTADGWRILTTDDRITAQQLVLAVPAYSAADLLESLAPALSAELRGIPYVDVANATLAFRAPDLPRLPPGTGFLVPPVEERFVVGCSWLTNKWPHLVNDDVVLIKSMVGRAGDRRWLTMSDQQIVEGVRTDLSAMLGIHARPFETFIQRWPQAMPQYVVGHAERLESIDRQVADIGHLHLTGAAYRGSGLAGCATQAAAVADLIAQGDSA
ncbi:MAG: protoporphyrinogen oxidase [Candidatus Nanopelagicales bacterium]